MSSKEEKLAAARKKLKEFQNKNKNTDSPKSPKDEHSYTYTFGNEHNDVMHTQLDRAPSSTKSTKSVSPDSSYHADDNYTTQNELYNDEIDAMSLREQEQMLWERRDTLPIGELSSLGSHLNHANSITQSSPPPVKINPSPLQIQIQNQSQTIAILVGERNELQRQLNHIQLVLNTSQRDYEELHGKYMNAMGSLRELNECKKRFEELVLERDAYKRELSLERGQLEASQNLTRDLDEQISELKRAIQANLEDKQKILHLEKQLEMIQLKLQQQDLDNNSRHIGDNDAVDNDKKLLEKRVVDLEKKLNEEREDCEREKRSFAMYKTQYSSHLQLLETQVNDLNREKLILEEDCKRLKETIETLENELKRNKLPNDDLKIKLNELEKEKARLYVEMGEKEEKMKMLHKMVEEQGNELTTLREQEKEKFKTKQEIDDNGQVQNAAQMQALLAAMESDKVAAATAVQQNVQLKQQLQEMQDAFIRLSDEKVELTNQLLTEQHQNKLLSQRIASEDDADLHDTDADTLRNIIAQLRADKQALMQKLKHHQHQEQHYLHEEHHHDSNHQNHNHENDDKNHHNHIHDHDHNHDHDHGHDDHHHHHQDHHHHYDNEKNEDLHRIIEQLQADKTALIQRLQRQPVTEEIEDPLVLTAMEKKLKETMDAVAALDEEKNRLEHLVLHLQGETETIGDYISLYQEQRRLMKERTREKDEQMQQLRLQLTALETLVKKLLHQEHNNVPLANNGKDKRDELMTVDRIKELITEIEATSLNPKIADHHAFQHCPCCSGRLINI